MTVILSGIPGCGKTTLLSEALKISPDLTIVNYGDEMLEIAAGQNIERDAIRKLPVPEQQAIGLLAAQKIKGRLKGITLIDTHALIKTPGGYFPGISDDILRALGPDAIVIVESPAEVILERRKKDKSRSRDTDTLQEIEYHQNLCRMYVTACSAIIGAVLIPIQNELTPSVGTDRLLKAINFFIAS